MKTSDTQVLKENYGYSFKVKNDPNFGIHDIFDHNGINVFIEQTRSMLYEKYNKIEFNNIFYNMDELNDLFYELELNKDKTFNHDNSQVLESLFKHFNYTYKELFNDGIFYYIYHDNISWNIEQDMEQNKKEIKEYFNNFDNNDFYSWCNGIYYTIVYFKNNKKIDDITGFTSEKYAIEYAKEEIKSYILEYEKTLDIIKDSLIEYDKPRYYYIFHKENNILKDDCYIILENFKNKQEKLLNDLIEITKKIDIQFINLEKLKQHHNFKFIQKKAYDKLEHQEIKELFDLVIDY